MAVETKFAVLASVRYILPRSPSVVVPRRNAFLADTRRVQVSADELDHLPLDSCAFGALDRRIKAVLESAVGVEARDHRVHVLEVARRHRERRANWAQHFVAIDLLNRRD